MEITDFAVVKLDNSKGALDMAKKLWADEEFIPSGGYWLATFKVDGKDYQAGIRLGRRYDVAEDHPLQADTQLRVPEEAFDADKFISEADVADITSAVSDKFVEGRYWEAL